MVASKLVLFATSGRKNRGNASTCSRVIFECCCRFNRYLNALLLRISTHVWLKTRNRCEQHSSDLFAIGGITSTSQLIYKRFELLPTKGFFLSAHNFGMIRTCDRLTYQQFFIKLFARPQPGIFNGYVASV